MESLIYNKKKISPYIIDEAKGLINKLVTEKNWTIISAEINFSYRVNTNDVYKLKLKINKTDIDHDMHNYEDGDLTVIEVSLVCDKISLLNREIFELKKSLKARDERLDFLEKRMEKFENKIKK